MLCIARHHGFALPAAIPHDRPYADAKSREQWDIPIGSQRLLLAKIPGPWPAVRDRGVLKRGSCVLRNLLGAGIRGSGPWAVVHDPRCTVPSVVCTEFCLRRPLSMTGLFVKNLFVAALGAIPDLPKGTRLRYQCQAGLGVGLRVAIEIGRNTRRKPRL